MQAGKINEECEYNFNQFSLIVGVLHSRATGSCARNLHCKCTCLFFFFLFTIEVNFVFAVQGQISSQAPGCRMAGGKKDGFSGAI